jgi:glycosyltransferase involved in cell wall biosynthesis
MKVIIQIPCFNEAGTLPQTLADLPRSLPDIDVVEWLVVDDGSRDDTVAVARAHGVDHVVSLDRNRGLAVAFETGLAACLERGADIIVNTDADNQYRAEGIAALIRPIVAGQADYVIGARAIADIEHFSGFKKFLQHCGSLVVRLASGTDIPDATSGFRALSRTAAQELRIFSRYTYTLESIIQAGHKGLRLAWTPVAINPPTRPSRLMRSLPEYVLKSLVTIVRVFVVYRPFRFFFVCGALLLSIGVLLALRFFWFYFLGQAGHVQSLVFSGIFCGAGLQIIMTGFVADLLSVNRRMLETLQSQVKALGESDAARTAAPKAHAHSD